MAKKKLDVEGDPKIDSSKSAIEKRKIRSVEEWFDSTCVDNRKSILAVCGVMERIAAEQFKMSNHYGVPEVWALIFYQTFRTILDFLAKKREEGYTEFEVYVAKCVIIGYTNYVDEESEKVGNFMPFMEWIGKDSPIKYNDHESHDDNFIRWKEQNTYKNAEFSKWIQDRAAWELNKTYGMNIGSPEAVIPIFCTFLDTLVSILKLDYQDAGEDVSRVKMNVLGLFEVIYSFDEEDNKEIVDFKPSITPKMELKNDSIAEKDTGKK